MLFGYAVMIAYDDDGGSGVVLQCPWRFRGGQKKPPQQSLSNRAELVCEGMGGSGPVRERRKQKQDGYGWAARAVVVVVVVVVADMALSAVGCSAYSRLGDVQRPDRARGEALCRVAVGHGGEPEEEGSVAQKVDALDVLCLLCLAVTGVRDAAVARSVGAADAFAQCGLERVELGVCHAQSERTVQGVQDVADGHVRRRPARAGVGYDGDRPGEVIADDRERWERWMCCGLTHHRVCEPCGRGVQ